MTPNTVAVVGSEADDLIAYVSPETISIVFEKYGTRVSISLSWEEWDTIVTRAQETRKKMT